MLEKLLSGYNADALPSNLVCVHKKSMGHDGAKDEIKMPEGPPAGSQTRILLVGIIYLPSLSQTAVTILTILTSLTILIMLTMLKCLGQY